MGTIVLDRSGDLRKSAFYRFVVPFGDSTDEPDETPEWIVVPPTPKNEDLERRGEPRYMWIEMVSSLETRVETKECPLDATHITQHYNTRPVGEGLGSKRTASFVAADTLDAVIITDGLRDRIERLELRGARLHFLDLKMQVSSDKLMGFTNLIFAGKAFLRMPKFIGAPNRCPYCGIGKIACEACGQWNPYCTSCKKEVAISRSTHKGPDDIRFTIEENPWRVLEGRTWDGSDLVQTPYRNFASKRFIDWLLRIHAAPFYAEPVWFCVDGMNDQQKKWFEELQKPLEA